MNNPDVSSDDSDDSELQELLKQCDNQATTTPAESVIQPPVVQMQGM